MGQAGCESEHLPSFQPASPSRPSPQGGRRRGSRRLHVDLALPIAGRLIVQTTRKAHPLAITVVDALVFRRMAVVAHPLAIEVTTIHVARQGWRRGAVATRPAIRVNLTVSRNAHVSQAKKHVRRSVASAGLATRTIGVASTTVTGAATARHGTGGDAPAVDPGVAALAVAAACPFVREGGARTVAIAGACPGWRGLRTLDVARAVVCWYAPQDSAVGRCRTGLVATRHQASQKKSYAACRHLEHGILHLVYGSNLYAPIQHR